MTPKPSNRMRGRACMSASAGAPPSVTEFPMGRNAGHPTQMAGIPTTEARGGAAHTLSHDERAAAGKALRDKSPRTQHAIWKKSEARRGSHRPPACGGYRPVAGACADPLRPDAPVTICLLPRDGCGDGRRSGANAHHRHQGAGMRRLPSDELRWLCHAGTQHHLRYQRLRRDIAGSVGMGRQAACRRPSFWRRDRSVCPMRKAAMPQ